MMKNTDHDFAVILAGGGGTRLWPKSRHATPKQFLRLSGKETMLQVTANRFSKLVPWEKIIVVTAQQYNETVKEQLPEIPVENIIAEPEKRDTSLAMLVGALYAKSKDPDAVIANDAADHVISDEQEFLRVMRAALQVAGEGENLVAVGITPTRAETGFGYIKVGEHLKKVNGGNSVFRVDSFTEKPNKPTAQAFISTGRYFWNANMYVWSAKSLQQAFKKHMPEVYALTEKLPKLRATEFNAALPEIYAKSPSISIDYAISEKADNLVLIPGDFGWDDVGDWKVVYELGKRDLAGNVVMSELDTVHTLAINSQNNLIHTNNRLVAIAGINDMIIVDTDEILLIVPKERSQDVKKLVERLKEEGKKEYL